MGVGVVIVAAGAGRRMGAEGNKVLLTLAGKTVLSHSVELFAAMEEVAEIVIVTREVDRRPVEELVATAVRGKRTKVVLGGKERQESVFFGLKALSPQTAWVIIHDGARPHLTKPVVLAGLQAVQEHLAVGVAVPVKDTIKRVQDGIIIETPPREELWAMQTPQIFSYPLIHQAHEQAQAQGILATDDCALVEILGHPVHIVQGEYSNIKITTPEDLPKEEKFLIGFGYDVHRLVEARPLILAGVQIPHTLGLLGHSDADVVTHAIMDALLGAAGLGDIGELFPDTDPRYKGISSIILLEQVLSLLSEQRLRINNLDITIMAQKPKLSPWKGQMRSTLARVMDLEESLINIKATTAEGLGFVGREEGIAAQVVVSLRATE
jgi:2-C-methyl-D-erythritol 4-phosphate cytidylyltransferase/2-C-methyl-D-erythritol 2,4-cyclodiphosphate synthase